MALRHVWLVISILSKFDCSQSSFLRKALIGDFASQAAILVECQIYTATRPPHPDTYETLTAARATSARSWRSYEKIGDCELSTSKLNDRWYTFYPSQAAQARCINYSMFWSFFCIVRTIPEPGKRAHLFRFSTFSGNFPVGRTDETRSIQQRAGNSGNFD